MKPPSHLSAAAKRLWHKLQSDYALDDAAGRLLLQSALEAYDRLQQAREILRKEGPVIVDRFEQKKTHPAVAIERDARAGMHAALRQLRLEPGALED